MRLPSGYTQLTYVMGDGNQYIDTGLIVQKSDSWQYVLDADLVKNNNYAGANGYLQYQANIGNGVKSEINIIYKNITETITVNGVQVSSQSWASYYGNNVKLGVLKLGDANNTWYSGAAQSGKIYSCKIYKSDILIRDFIPCYNPSNVAGLYDVVNNKFYASASSTSFSGGQIIKTLNMPVNIGGSWKDSDNIYVNINGVWKEADSAYVNIDGTWKELG